MGDHEDRGAVGIELFQQLEHARAGGAVEVPRGLIGEHDRWSTHERPGDRDPLALAAGELARPEARTLSEPHPRKRLRCPFTALGHSDAGVEESFGDVLQGGGVLREEELLEDEPDPGGAQRGELAVG